MSYRPIKDSLTNNNIVGPINITTYLQWLRDNPYAIVKKEQNKLISLLQLMQEIQFQEAKKLSIWFMLAKRIDIFLSKLQSTSHKHRRVEDEEELDAINNNQFLTIQDQQLIDKLEDIDALSLEAYQLDIEYHHSTFDLAQDLLSDTSFLPSKVKESIISDLELLKKTIFHPSPSKKEIIEVAKKIHPAIPLTVLGGVPDPEDSSKLITQHEIVQKVFGKLEKEITAACEQCPLPADSLSNNPEYRLQVKNHALRTMVSELLLLRHPNATEKMDFKPIDDHMMQACREKITKVAFWKNPKVIHLAAKLHVEREIVRDKIQTLMEEIQPRKMSRPTPFGTRR